MLEMRPSCECCDRDLPPEAADAWICSYECTWCSDCVGVCLENRCRNCGGDLSRRPTRDASNCQVDPPSTTRVHVPGNHRG